MIQLSKKLLTFVPSVETDWQHRGELLSFDPSENLENSSEGSWGSVLLIIQKG